jgi:hypothetical protein
MDALVLKNLAAAREVLQRAPLGVALAQGIGRRQPLTARHLSGLSHFEGHTSHGLAPCVSSDLLFVPEKHCLM